MLSNSVPMNDMSSVPIGKRAAALLRPNVPRTSIDPQGRVATMAAIRNRTGGVRLAA